MSSNSAVPQPIAQLIDLFEAELPAVAFPGVDAATLRGLADTMEATATALDDAEQALTVARREHSDARSAIALASEQGLGYARVYAAKDEALSAKLAEVALDKPKRKAPAKRKSLKPPPRLDAQDSAEGGTLTELPFVARKAKGTSGAA